MGFREKLARLKKGYNLWLQKTLGLISFESALHNGGSEFEGMDICYELEHDSVAVQIKRRKRVFCRENFKTARAVNMWVMRKRIQQRSVLELKSRISRDS